MTTSQTPLSELLHAVDTAHDLDQAYIIAGAMNLYTESIRRRASRSLLGPEDVFSLFSIIRTLLTAGDLEQQVREVAKRNLRGAPQ